MMQKQESESSDVVLWIIIAFGIYISLETKITAFVTWFEAINWIQVGLILFLVVLSVFLIFHLIGRYKERRQQKQEIPMTKKPKEKPVMRFQVKEARIKKPVIRETQVEQQKVIITEPEQENERVRDIIAEQKQTAYLADKLNDAEIEYLQYHKYEKKDFVPLGKTRQQKYLVKPQAQESKDHTLLVYVILQEIRKHTKQVQTFATTKPDIIFTVNNQEIALEIETGINLKKNKNRLIEKRRRNNQIYGPNWYFVPYHSRDAKSYAKYGKTIRRTQIKAFLKQTFMNQLNR